MKEVFLVLPMLFKSGFRKRVGEKGNPILPHLAIGILILIQSINGAIEMIPAFSLMSEKGILAGFIATVFVLAMLVSALFSLAPMIGMLYYSKDGEFYLQLPLNPSSVYFAKLIYLYLSQLYVSVLVSAPVLITIGITQGMSVVYYIVSLLALVITPFFGLVITSIIAIPIVATSSLFKNRGAVSSIALIILFTLVIVAYLVLSLSGGQLQSSSTVEIFAPTIKTVSQIAIPFLALANASMLLPNTVFGVVSNVFGAVLLNLLVAVVFFAVVSFVALFLGKIFYNKGVSALLENRKITQKGDNVLRKSKQFISFLKQEYRCVMRNSSFAFSTIGMLVLCPVWAVVLSLTVGGEFLGFIAYGMVYGVTLGMGVTLNTGASITFSKDGESFYALKYLPVNKKAVISAKLVFSCLLSTLFISLSLVVALIILKSSWYNWFSLFTVPLICLGMTAMDMLWDLRRPNLHWTSISDLAKNSSNVIVPTIVGMGIMFLILIPSVFFLVYLGEIGYLYAYLFTLVVGIVLSSVFVPMLDKKGEIMIDRVE